MRARHGSRSWRRAFRPRLEALEQRCVLTHGVLQSFDLAPGQKVFWDGEYVDRAVTLGFIFTGDDELEATPIGEHFEYQINVKEAGAYRLRVALDGILHEFRGENDPLWDITSTFRLQVLRDRDGDGRMEALADGFTFLNDYIVVFVPTPDPGAYTVRVVPGGVIDRSFRMRAKLEAAPPAYDEPTLLLPNLRITPPFEPTFVTPSATFGPGFWVPGQPVMSYMADELTDTTSPPAGRLGLRFSAGVEDAGPGPLWIMESQPRSFEEMVLSKPAHQKVLRSDGAIFVKGADGQWYECVMKDGTWVPPDGVETRPAGEFELHAAHGHYHYQGIYTYQLWSVANPAARKGQDAGLAQVGDGHKLGFAPGDERMIDWHRFYQARAGSQRRSDIGDGAMLSSGWADIYEWNRSGQYVDFPANPDGTPVAGYYLIRGIADIDNKIIETSKRDNTSYTYIRVENTETGPRITILERGYGTDPWDNRKVVDGPLGSPSDPDDLILGPVIFNPNDPVSQDSVLFFLDDYGMAELGLTADAQEASFTVDTGGRLWPYIAAVSDYFDRESEFTFVLQADVDTGGPELLDVSLDGSGSLIGLLEFTIVQDPTLI